MTKSVRVVFAEAFGAFCIVFLGSASVMSAPPGSSAQLIAAALAYSMTIIAAAAAFSHLSTDFNPAVTVAMILARRTTLATGAKKILAQFGGAVIGAYGLSLLFPPDVLRETRVGGTYIASSTTFSQAIALEAIATAVLVLTIFGVIKNGLRPGIAAVVVGFTVGADILAIGQRTGASMNPARSFGPALASGIWEGHMAFWVGPILGAVAAALIWRYVIEDA